MLSLALITVSFRQSVDGPVAGAQNVGATAVYPFVVAADRVAAPFRDLYGWATGVLHAKSENARLREEVDALRQRYLEAESALQENVKLRQLLHYQDIAGYPADFRQVNARVIARPSSLFEQTILIAAGSRNGIDYHDPVVTEDGLVGEVTRVMDRASRVTLLTDPDSAVAAHVLSSGASGLIRRGPGDGRSLVLDQVTKEQVVNIDDIVLTAGTLGGRLRSIFPRGIQIGVVTSVGQTDTDLYKQVQVDPYVDFSDLHSVAVLVSTRPKPRLP
ncbi:MAG: rod shape-determining protein MreC [Actinomycetota bacterium]|nr:rod shape-determining protein MreC [Actinomycetota bacterium]